MVRNGDCVDLDGAHPIARVGVRDERDGSEPARGVDEDGRRAEPGNDRLSQRAPGRDVRHITCHARDRPVSAGCQGLRLSQLCTIASDGDDGRTRAGEAECDPLAQPPAAARDDRHAACLVSHGIESLLRSANVLSLGRNGRQASDCQS